MEKCPYEDANWPTVQTLIRLLLKKQSDLDLHCLLRTFLFVCLFEALCPSQQFFSHFRSARAFLSENLENSSLYFTIP